jgi:TrmH family RNA methyltransferase
MMLLAGGGADASASLEVEKMRAANATMLTSARNPLLQDVRRAIARGTLTEEGFSVAESFHLLEEALRSDCDVKCVLAAVSVRSTVESHVRGLSGLRVFVVADELFRQISSTESSQGVIALVRPPAWNLEQLFRGRSLVVILDGIQDPGNAGAIVRAAEAFGATGAIFLKGAVNPYNPKTLRASAGSLFRLPMVHGLDGTLARAALEQRRLDVYAAMPEGRKTLDDVDLTRRFALIVGSEGRGVSEKLRAGAFDLRIPTAGVESLNVAMTAGIILYEARRQRMLRQ